MQPYADGGVVVLDYFQFIHHFNFNIEFLAKFAPQAVRGSLPWLKLAAGKLPQSGKRSPLAALADQYVAIVA
ncbi:MAG TPA: hypothetical protein VFC78_24365 [Tepidisphaeraceae bacterium]|nr:hypothetical protein [Tepidisphaeraceae bacterium]